MSVICPNPTTLTGYFNQVSKDVCDISQFCNSNILFANSLVISLVVYQYFILYLKYEIILYWIIKVLIDLTFIF